MPKVHFCRGCNNKLFRLGGGVSEFPRVETRDITKEE